MTARLMGILNVTPDSFSGDGLLAQADPCGAALAQAQEMIGQGATILDVGGESTRPGAAPVGAEEEARRILPVIEALALAHPDVLLSVDTFKPEVARAALKAGAGMLNDISGSAMRDEMFALAAEKGAQLVLMHNRAGAAQRQAGGGGVYAAPFYKNVVEEVAQDLADLAARAVSFGVSREKIVLDPGIGFGKSPEDTLRLILAPDRLKKLGFPVLIAPSRKSFIGAILGDSPEDRLAGTAAVCALSAWRGADILRVHDVGFMARITKMALAAAAAERAPA